MGSKSAAGSSITAWILTGYTLTSIVVSGVLPVQGLILLCLLGKACHDGVVENSHTLHRTVQALETAAERYVDGMHKAAERSCCCARCWPKRKPLVRHHMLAGDDSADLEQHTGGLRSWKPRDSSTGGANNDEGDGNAETAAMVQDSDGVGAWRGF